MRTDVRRRSLMRGLAVLAALAVLPGCASFLAHKNLEQVAKDWCDTIRASQVICVYPLTEDLRPGDVFLVQVPIEEQATLYRKRGFLSLDDHRARLRVDYRTMYFDGYWKDEFGSVPHARPSRPDAGPVDPGKPEAMTISETPAPRAAFPSYSFEVNTRTGLSLALPIHGIPVSLAFMRSERAAATVTIADARTYGAGMDSLYETLQQWAGQPEIRRMLRDVQRMRGDQPLFLRVISRVYLSGGIVVSLNRLDSLGAEVAAGVTPARPPSPDADTAKGVEAMGESVSALASALRKVSGYGGAVNLAQATSRAVTVSQTFDRPLIVGYVAFDVPVFRGGLLGHPLPAFERLEGQGPAPAMRADQLSSDQMGVKFQLDGLKAIAGERPDVALRVMALTIEQLKAEEFSAVRQKIDAARAASKTSGQGGAVQEAVTSFVRAAERYVSVGGQSGPRYAVFSDALSRAYDRRDE